MTTFKSADEANDYIGGIFTAGLAHPKLSAVLARSGLIMRMNLSEPDTVITADLIAGELTFGEPAPEPNMTLTLTSETANRFWQGKVSLPLALARGQIKLSGEMPRLVALLPSAKTMNAAYIERLKADGREDLLA